MKNRGKGQTSLSRWIWLSFFKIALLPLVVIGVVFVIIYFMTNMWSLRTFTAYMDESIANETIIIADSESGTISEQLDSITESVDLYAKQLQRAYEGPIKLAAEDASRLKWRDDGIYYTESDSKTGGAAVFYSGYVPVGELEKDKTAKLLTTQYLMKDMQQSNPLIASIYINTFDSLNIIYPYFDVLSQYPLYMDIPSYNFYYEADEAHNPERKTVWTDSYLDPAGHGWMTSAIKPIYRNGKLEGVAGIDITINTIVQRVLNLSIPYGGYCMLVGSDGMLLAIPAAGEADWGVNELTDHHYQEAILQDTFKPDAFNLLQRSDITDFTKTLFEEESGATRLMLSGDNHEVAWSTIDGIDWKLLIVLPTANIYSDADRIRSQITETGILIIAGFLVIYIIYYSVLFRRAYHITEEIGTPLREINDVVLKIGEGEYFHSSPVYMVTELAETSEGIVRMGEHLGEANEQLMSTQRQLLQSQRDLEALVVALEDIVIECDADGSILNLWSDKMSLLQEYEKDERGYTINTFFGREIGERITNQFLKVAREGTASQIEFKLRDHDGEHWYQAKIAQIAKASNAFAVSAREVTERIMMEQSVIASKEIAEKANLSKTEFISQLSNELRTSLNAVLGFAQVLKYDEESLDQNQLEAVSEIINAGTHLLSQTNMIFNYSRVEGGVIDLNIESIKMADLFEEINSIVRHLSSQTSVQVKIKASACSERQILADRLRLKQILINLLSNAINYNRPDGEVNVYCEVHDTLMRFHVVDTGYGIPETEIENIFKPFYRIQQKGNTTDGSGIGLSVSKELIEAMSGEMGAESTIDEGSHFWFDLKLSDL
ncbi:sensor histidine kinase [Fusibacter paucivorans]|uniref:histidine kinase n=1 Tax=Fusibacter paucivorans TaxID=76009 RepID=A0ABS5PMH6_9FIRM|nr:sensor histidine kinase [Fusibacter paucivorans]MBS7526263.1 sensor histidine kinase [Fusibacter paucivorans]